MKMGVGQNDIQSQSIYFIAEISINHNGIFGPVIKLIDLALYAVVNSVWFQVRHIDHI